jgi:DNA-binding response OmpR family regulator
MIDKNVLLIDDDTDLLQLAGLIFKKAGAKISTAQDGLEGMSKLFNERPHLIVLDVMLPGMDGFEICQRIRQVSDVPIIMLTSLNHEKEMLRGLELGRMIFYPNPSMRIFYLPVPEQFYVAQSRTTAIMVFSSITMVI